MKKFFTTLIVAVMTLFAFPFSGCKDSSTMNLDFRLYTGGQSYYVAGIGKETSTDIVIPSEYNGKPVVGVGGKSFKGNNKITSIVIPSSIEWVGVGAFRDCPSLKKVVWNAVKASTNEVKYTDRVFLGSENIEEFIFGSTVEEIPSGLFAYSNGSKITELTLPAGLKKVAANVFSSSNRINISVASLNKWLAVEKSGDGAPLSPSYSLTIGGNLAETLDVSGLSGVTAIGENEFKGCTSIKSVNIGAEITSIARSAFLGCTSFETVTVDDSNEYFYERDGVVYSRGSNAITVVPSALGGEITLPSGVPIIYENAFFGTNIEKVTIPGSVALIGKNAFADCKSLTTVTIGEGTTTIDSGAFMGGTALTTLIVPKSVTSIGIAITINCPSVTIYYLGETLPSRTAWQSLPVWLYSESVPTEGGNYWHYDTDGTTPIKWDTNNMLSV